MSWIDLKDRVAIVTGAAAGIGRDVAVGLADNGCRVVVADINEAGREIVDNLPGGAERHLFVPTDVSDKSSVDDMVGKTVDKFGILEILVNNAGILLPRLLVDPNDAGGKYELNEQDFDRMVSINQKGAYLCAQAAARQMIDKGIEGVIINMTSESGLEGSQGQSCYAATKGALYSFTRSWAKELGKYGIRVVGVAPGIVEKTELRTQKYEEALAYTRGITVQQLREGYEKVSVPLGRVGNLKEIADLVCFLVSDKASYTTGTTYNITGGKSRA